MPSHEPSELVPAHATALWRVRLLGGMHVHHRGLGSARLGSRSVAALLARLAMFPQRSHAREELIELLWPGVSLDVGRNRLRQALFALRQCLEPPGPVAAPVLLADRASVRVVPGAFDCDVTAFERCLREGHYTQALELYAGELMPGFYDDWIDDERLRLAALFERASAAMPEVVAPATPTAPIERPVAPPTGSKTVRSSLPIYLTRFIGRDAEGARLRADVLGHRLVTVLGPGGSGKTRLAVELAAALRQPAADLSAETGAGFDTVAFVPLVNCSSRAQVLDALLASLHLRQQDADPLEALSAALAGRGSLLVLDNFEQLSGVAEDVVAQLVTSIAGLHLIVTSRRVLGLDGEREFWVQPLALPHADLPLDEAAINPSVALFVDRARAVRADFHVGPNNLAAVTGLVHLLEGMPLAIELAAARVRSITPATMAQLLRDARDTPAGQTLDLLTRTGPRSGSDLRHASMLRVIEWSWRLLDPPQARLLAALTVFHGGCTAAAVHAVCGPLAENPSLRLDELMSHSLLRVSEPDIGETRYSTSEPVREFAALQLGADDTKALRASHRAWLTTWAATLPPTPTLAEVRLEMPNLLAALSSALADDAPEASILLMLPLRRVLEDVELPADGLASLEAAVDRCSDAALRSQGHTLLAPLMFIAGRSDDALRHAERGLEGAPPGAPWRGRALHAAARVRWRATRLEEGVAGWLDEAEALATAADDTELLASVIALRAFVANGRRDHVRGEALHLEALALWEKLGNRHAVNSGRYNLAVCAQNAGRHEETLARLAVIEPDARDLHDWRRLSQMLNVRGNALSELRRWPEAVASFRDCARLAWDCFALHELAYVLWNMPRALAHVREPERALQLAAFAQTFWQTRFGRLSAADLLDIRRVKRLASKQLDAKRVAALWANGERLPLAEAMALALR